MASTNSITAIQDLGTILGVWAHPDDESFGTGGLVALAVRNGQEVVCVTATKGEAGVQDVKRWPPEKLGEIRAEELQKALKILGISKHHWLGCRDGHCQEANSDEMTSKLVEFIDKYKVDTILTFPPDGLTGHEDHKAVCKWACRAAEKSLRTVKVYFVVETQDAFEDNLRDLNAKHNLFFNIKSPFLLDITDCDLALALPHEVSTAKLKALRSMPSQYELLFSEMTDEQLCDMLCHEAYVSSERADLWQA